MKTAYLRATAGLATALAAGLAGAQTYSTYPSSGYGYATGSGLVRCESINSRSNFCRVDTRAGVSLYRQLSREDCIRGRNWQVRTDGIVVDDGCRAEFAIGTAYAANAGTAVGYDRYGRPLYTTGSAYVTDRYGNRIYVSSIDRSRGYVVDRYGNRIMLTGTSYRNSGIPTVVGVDPYASSGGYYMTDRYGNRVWVSSSTTGSGGYYTTDRYGNRVWVSSTTSTGGYYSTDRYGNRIWVDTGAGGYYTDAYGRQVYTDPTSRDYDYDNDGYVEGSYEGYGAYGGTYTPPVTSSSSVIFCTSAPTGRTYCGDRNTAYTMHTDSSSRCLLNRTYGRDSNGTWVSGGCNLRLEASGY